MELTPQKNLELADQAWHNCLDSLAQYHYRQAVNTMRQQSSFDAESMAHGLAMLAIFEKNEGEYEKAAEFYSEAIIHLERMLGPGHKATIFHMGLKTSCLHEAGNLAEAEEIARLALSRAKLALGPKHRYLGDAFMKLALILWDRGSMVEAETYLRTAISHDMDLQGKESGFHAVGMMTLAEFLEANGRFQEALAVIEHAREIVSSNDVFTEDGETALTELYASIKEKLKLTH